MPCLCEVGELSERLYHYVDRRVLASLHNLRLEEFEECLLKVSEHLFILVDLNTHFN